MPTVERQNARAEFERGWREAMGWVTTALYEEEQMVTEDERYHYPPANTDVNAGLALIQVDMGARMGLIARLRSTVEALRNPPAPLPEPPKDEEPKRKETP